MPGQQVNNTFIGLTIGLLLERSYDPSVPEINQGYLRDFYDAVMGEFDDKERVVPEWMKGWTESFWVDQGYTASQIKDFQQAEDVASFHELLVTHVPERTRSTSLQKYHTLLRYGEELGGDYGVYSTEGWTSGYAYKYKDTVKNLMDVLEAQVFRTKFEEIVPKVTLAERQEFEDYIARGDKVVQSIKAVSQDIGMRIGKKLFSDDPSPSRTEDIGKMILLINGSLAPFRDQLPTNLDVLMKDETLFTALLGVVQAQTDGTQVGYWFGTDGKQLKSDFMENAREAFDTAIEAALIRHKLIPVEKRKSVPAERASDADEIVSEAGRVLVDAPKLASRDEQDAGSIQRSEGFGVETTGTIVPLPSGNIQLIFDLKGLQASAKIPEAARNFALLQRIIGNPVVVIDLPNTSPAQVEQLEAGVMRVLESPEYTRALVRSGSITLGDSSVAQDGGKLLVSSSQKRDVRIDPTALIHVLRQQFGGQGVMDALSGISLESVRITGVPSLQALESVQALPEGQSAGDRQDSLLHQGAIIPASPSRTSGKETSVLPQELSSGSDGVERLGQEQTMSDDYFERGDKVVKSIKAVSQDIGMRIGKELFGKTPSSDRMKDIAKIVSLIDGSLAPFRDQLPTNLDVLLEDEVLFAALLQGAEKGIEDTWVGAGTSWIGLGTGGKHLKQDFMQKAGEAFNTAISDAIERHRFVEREPVRESAHDVSLPQDSEPVQAPSTAQGIEGTESAIDSDSSKASQPEVLQAGEVADMTKGCTE